MMPWELPPPYDWLSAIATGTIIGLAANLGVAFYFLFKWSGR